MCDAGSVDETFFASGLKTKCYVTLSIISPLKSPPQLHPLIRNVENVGLSVLKNPPPRLVLMTSSSPKENESQDIAQKRISENDCEEEDCTIECRALCDCNFSGMNRILRGIVKHPSLMNLHRAGNNKVLLIVIHLGHIW